jgi:hypothetical protein
MGEMRQCGFDKIAALSVISRATPSNYIQLKTGNNNWRAVNVNIGHYPIMHVQWAANPVTNSRISVQKQFRPSVECPQ